ncbi:MAG TPA: O-antigen ligase family protein [Candidatus Saccharimonadales bacterium]|nr:O-antigen ligase family protein [Candidatus Saccharimonadales bacterium]
MKASALKYTVLSWVSGFTMLILLLMPLYGFLTVWAGSMFGHYTAIRLWQEGLLVLCVVGVLYLIAVDHKIRTHTLSRRLVWTILAYIAINLIWGAIAYNRHAVTAKALGYGLIVDVRFPVFFLVTWAVALRMARLRTHWQWLVSWPAFIVVIFGLLQIFILPHDFLKHFGYGPSTIPIQETINHNPQYLRIASTLRGANPLGAYLIIPISLLTVQLARVKRNWRQALFLVAALVVLFYSFSRSAWIGAALSIGIILVISSKSQKIRQLTLVGSGVLLILLAGIFITFAHNARFQNFVFHTQSNSQVKSTSDQGHASALRAGLNDLRHDPLGRGPGSAGPASVYNTGHAPRIAENFYVQIGQETGWLGLYLFIVINLGVGYLLWLRRSDPLALSLFASLIGLTLINMFSHAWADPTLAYVWWGLAGVAMAPLPGASKKDAT